MEGKARETRLQRTLRELLAARAMTPSELSRRAVGHRDAVRNIFRGRSRSPRVETLEAIAGVLEIDVAHLIEAINEEPRAAADHRRPGRGDPREAGRQAAGPEPRGGWPRDLPILGEAQGALLDRFRLSATPIGWTARPPQLAGLDGAFAVYMRGGSMRPRYLEGELLLVHPTRPPGPGAFVLIELETGEAFVKRFRRVDDGDVVADQLDPPAEIRYAAASIKRVLRIVGSFEEG